MSSKPTVAVIGSGIAGLTAAYILRKAYDVTLYEAQSRLGGHTHTHSVMDSNGVSHNVDSGFIVHNIHTYPCLLRLFAEIGVQTEPTSMSTSISCRECGLEFAGSSGWGGIFPSLRSVTRSRYLKLLYTIGKFNKDAKRLAEGSGGDDITLHDFIVKGGYSAFFEQHYILPIVAAVWSCEFDQAQAYPAKYLFQFLNNHGMLVIENLKANESWRVVKGGSSAYISKITPLLHKVETSVAAVKLKRQAGQIAVMDSTGRTIVFDKAVVATHPDEALKLLDNPTKLEKQILGAFQYTNTTTLLHTDTAVLPKNRRVTASWNYLIPSHDPKKSGIRLSYDMNRLQHIHSPEHYIVSLDSVVHIDPEKIIATMQYQHPLFTLQSVKAQRRLPELNSSTLAFAGAYHGWGFHEDGCRSGKQAAAALGVDW